jgi:hypothetical protein
VSLAKPSLADRLTELSDASADQVYTSNEADAVLEGLRADYPDFEKFISRRFTRLPARLQHTILDIFQQAEARTYGSLLQEWSRSSSLSIFMRVRVMTTMVSLGIPIDSLYRNSLLQAESTLSQLRTAASSVLSETGELQETWRDAMVTLPFELALEVGRDVSADHPATALAILQVLLSIADSQDRLILIKTMADIPLMDSVMSLQRLLTDTTDKSVQKAIKKALHSLRAQGLVFEDTPKHPHSVVVGAVTHRLENCYASHIDGAGNRALWMIRTKPFGGYNIAYLLINYGTGIQRAQGLQASKRELPQLLDEAQKRVRLIELEPIYCQYQVAMAHQMNLDTRTPVPEEFFAIGDIIGEANTTFEQAIIYSVLSEADLQEVQTYTDHAEQLLAVPEFGGWTLPASIIQKYGDLLREIEESHIVVSSALKQERAKEIYARATEEVLGEASRHIMQLRLEEMAYYLLRTDRRREALWAVVAAQSMQESSPTGLKHNHFIEALLERSLESAKERPGSRIIQPFSQLPDRGESRLII